MNQNPTKEYEFLKDAKGVIHIGASTGQERDIYASYNLPVLWIEAIPEACEALASRIEHYDNQIAIGALIADEDGKVYTFRRTNNEWSSSIFPLKEHLNVWPEVKEVERYSQTSRTLPSVIKQYQPAIQLDTYDTLVLDVQGAELKVLMGAKELLSNLRFIRCEASNVELYEGQCLDVHLIRWLSQNGFKFKEKFIIPNPKSNEGIETSELLFESFRFHKNCKILDTNTGKEISVNVGVVASNPRLGFQAHASCVFQAFGNKGFPVARMAGAFWEQSMQGGMNNLIRNYGTDYIITLDYDSLFSPDDVNNLLLLAARHPEADCIAGWQAKRHDGPPTALVGWLNKTKDGFEENIPREKVFSEEITQVDHTVFGLTLLKVDALLRMPKPWFQSFPNEFGEWEEGKVDADAYFFRKWRECGNTIYMANCVKLGHLEENVLWIDDGLNPIRQSLNDYHKRGRPF